MSPTTTYGDAEGFAPASAATADSQAASGWCRNTLDTLKRWRRLRADLHALQALDDRMLSDIGLDRGHLDAAVSGRR